MNNLPVVNLGIVAVSRDCFLIQLSQKRKTLVLDACKKLKLPVHLPVQDIEPVVENETDAMKALEDIRKKGVNALVIYLGNFGPEGPETLLAQKFGGPVMFAGAAEETGDDLINGRGDAYCGMLNASYNIGLRGLQPYIPEYPVGIPDEIARMIADFMPVASVLLGLKSLKIFSFGPRPQDFLACNAPIKALYDLGVEIMENSELDLYDVFLSAKGHTDIPKIAAAMAAELGRGNKHPGLLEKLAQYEVGLVEFMKKNLGASSFGVFANKCWPSFEEYFGFVPCYVNSRFASRGIPISCEVDIYGVLSEYMAACATGLPVTLLDINNTVPYDMTGSKKPGTAEGRTNDLFMGFHCGNTPSGCIANPEMKYQLIMHRLMEPGKDPDITRGTLEGRIKPGSITLFRLQSTADSVLKAYVAQGEVLDMDPKSFGGIGVFSIPEMGRFYRHVLIEKRFPHHTAVAFSHAGRILFDACRTLGIPDISVNQPKTQLYPTENPF